VNLTLQPVRVATDYDEDGCLVFADNRLVAVLVRLSEHHGHVAGQWFYETGFGRLNGPEHPIFLDLDVAQDYIRDRLAQVAAQHPA
jgi:hypothetical protein